MDQGKEVVVEISSRSSLLIPLLFHAHFGGRIYPIILTIFVLFHWKHIPYSSQTLYFILVQTSLSCQEPRPFFCFSSQQSFWGPGVEGAVVSLERVSQRHMLVLLSWVTGTGRRVKAKGERVQPPLLSQVTHSAMPVHQNTLHHKYFAPKVGSYEFKYPPN